jgi:alkanesulfonate monooxygenase SsuD/methylene tetrahydromethanopterin reductase-like flavin-dependent oxidoreductase (luciferase family)
VIIQAGASDRGRSFAARWAEVIFNISPTRDHMRKFTASVRDDVARAGRPETDCKVLVAVMPFVGRDRAEAEDKRDAANALVDPLAGLSTLAAHSNMDLSALPLDEPVSELRGSGSQSMTGLASRIAKDERLTLREIGRRYGQSVLLPQLCGTAGQIAEEMADIFREGAADGFVVSGAFLPDSLAEFVDAVVPELQRLGVLRRAYGAGTLRGHLQEP